MSSKEQMKQSASEAAAVLKLLSHEVRLVLVCSLNEGEKSVGSLVEELGIRQSSVSQHLAKLRNASVVDTRKVGQVVYYSISDARIAAIIQTMYEQFCAPNDAAS